MKFEEMIAYLSRQEGNYEPADIVVYIPDKGIVLKEKSLVAFYPETGKIAAFGKEAENISSGNPKGISVVSPLRQGMIADYMMAVKLFSHLLLKAFGKKTFRKPAVGICVPKGITEVEKKAMEDVFIQAGARDIFITDIPVKEFVKEFPKLSSKYKIIIGITKDEPEKYIMEEISQIFKYAQQEGISIESLAALGSLRNS